jgi:hypothetical protein
LNILKNEGLRVQIDGGPSGMSSCCLFLGCPRTGGGHLWRHIFARGQKPHFGAIFSHVEKTHFGAIFCTWKNLFYSGGEDSANGQQRKRLQRVEILKIAEPCPLIDPSQVVVTQGEILVADPVLTPIGKKRWLTTRVTR